MSDHEVQLLLEKIAKNLNEIEDLKRQLEAFIEIEPDESISYQSSKWIDLEDIFSDPNWHDRDDVDVNSESSELEKGRRIITLPFLQFRQEKRWSSVRKNSYKELIAVSNQMAEVQINKIKKEGNYKSHSLNIENLDSSRSDTGWGGGRQHRNHVLQILFVKLVKPITIQLPWPF